MITKRFRISNASEKSIVIQLRRHRFQILLDMIGNSAEPLSILDIGGTAEYWQMMTAGLQWDRRIHVTLLNLEATPALRRGFTSVSGDARAMPEFANQQFDIVFSNSTIEHVGELADQRKMANEVRRLGRAYYVQTPNRHFPIEPHFMFPFLQFLPIATRVWIVEHWYQDTPNHAEAVEAVEGIRLLDRAELLALFPGATLHEERVCGLVKSFVVAKTHEG